MSFRPIKNRVAVIVSKEQEKTTDSGIIYQEKSPRGIELGVVASVGEEVESLKPGDIIYWHRGTAEGTYGDFLIVKEEHIFAVVDDEAG